MSNGQPGFRIEKLEERIAPSVRAPIDDDARADDSTVLCDRRAARDLLDVYQAGHLTVVGFGGVDVPDDACVASYKQQLTNLIWSHDCQVLAFDLTGVTFLSGGMLGLLVLLRDDVREIQLFNASTEVREVLSGENLNALFSLHEVDVSE